MRHRLLPLCVCVPLSIAAKTVPLCPICESLPFVGSDRALLRRYAGALDDRAGLAAFFDELK